MFSFINHKHLSIDLMLINKMIFNIPEFVIWFADSQSSFWTSSRRGFYFCKNSSVKLLLQLP